MGSVLFYGKRQQFPVEKPAETVGFISHAEQASGGRLFSSLPSRGLFRGGHSEVAIDPDSGVVLESHQRWFGMAVFIPRLQIS